MAYKGSTQFNLHQDKNKRKQMFEQYQEDKNASNIKVKTSFDKIVSVDLARRGIKLKKSY